VNGGREAALPGNKGRRKLGDKMEALMNEGVEIQETPEQRLWRAVIASTVSEWIKGPLRQQRSAEQYLFDDDHDFRTVCTSAGIDPENLRDRLRRIRTRQEAEAQACAERN
jgi:hypothetical protein